MITIRTFEETDRTELRTLFGRAGQESPFASLWGHAPSEAVIYLDAYMDLEPDSLFVAVAEGQLAGYLTGCLDSSKFPSEDERIRKAIRTHRLIVRPRTARFLGRAMVDVASATVRREATAGELVDRRWPSHLHINVASAVRGTGAADGLMRQWLDRVKEADSPGCYLQTLAENTRAVRFFERMGFAKHGPTLLVPGVRHGGKRLHQQTMVWSP